MLKTTHETPIAGCKIVEFDLHLDDRGMFQESFSKEDFDNANLPTEWAQDNVAISYGGVLRGLHTQLKNPQGKLIRCFAGSIFDVCVDLRGGSPTFLKWFGLPLSWDRNLGLYIPPGCAHGFYVTAKSSMVHYKCTTEYEPDHQGGVWWNDPRLKIEWPMLDGATPIVSSKDAQLPTILEFLKTIG